MIIADYHVHSEFSSDSQASMESMIERAIQLGLQRLCFTDHMDIDYPQKISGYNFVFDPEAYMKKLSMLKEQYKDKIDILMGIELGLQPHITDQMTALIQRYPFDFIIGSTHLVDHVDTYFPEYWKTRSKYEGIYDYFNSIILNCSTYQGFHVYGHLDYIIRYVPTASGIKEDYSYSDYADVLDEALRAIIDSGKGIEVNSAGLKYGLGYPHPKADVLTRYRELGGELITIGSDAHKPEHLCYDFHLIPDILKSLGYGYYAVFKEGKPEYIKL